MSHRRGNRTNLKVILKNAINDTCGNLYDATVFSRLAPIRVTFSKKETVFRFVFRLVKGSPTNKYANMRANIEIIYRLRASRQFDRLSQNWILGFIMKSLGNYLWTEKIFGWNKTGHQNFYETNKSCIILCCRIQNPNQASFFRWLHNFSILPISWLAHGGFEN